MAGGCAWSSRRLYCDGALPRAIREKVDLESHVAKHFPKLESAVAGYTVVDGEGTSQPKPGSSQVLVRVLAVARSR